MEICNACKLYIGEGEEVEIDGFYYHEDCAPLLGNPPPEFPARSIYDPGFCLEKTLSDPLPSSNKIIDFGKDNSIRRRKKGMKTNSSEPNNKGKASF